MIKFFENPVIATLLLVALIAFCILVLNVAGSPTLDRVEWCEETYRVQRGDSLWTVSRDYCPENVDRREWIDKVQSLNGLTSDLIYPGQELLVLVPVEEG